MLRAIRRWLYRRAFGCTPEQFRAQQKELKQVRELLAAEPRQRSPIAFDDDFEIGYRVGDPGGR